MRLRESSHFGAERNNRIVPGASVINPPASTLGSLNAILTGTSRSYRVGDFIGALSIKAVISGRANWHVGSRTFAVGENCYLVLNDRQRYALTIDSPEETTTFCLFFQRGFVEDIWRASLSSSSRLLDAPESGENDPSPGFFERLEPWSDSLRTTVRHVYRLVRSHEIESGVWEESFVSVGEALVRHEACVLQKAAALPVIRASTRMELCKRANRARDLLLSSWNRSVSLGEVAREACLSPYHLHRLFRRFFGKTPHQLVSDYRLEWAAEQLRESRDTVTDLCFRAGFGSLPSFSTLFRRRYGRSPGEYRRINGRTVEIRKIR